MENATKIDDTLLINKFWKLTIYSKSVIMIREIVILYLVDFITICQVLYVTLTISFFK